MKRTTLHHRILQISTGLTLGAAATLAMGQPSHADGNVQVAQAKSVVTMGADRVGSMVNAMSSGLAKVITQNSPVSVRVRAFAGPEVWMPQLNAGRLDIGVQSSATAWMDYNKVASKVALRNMRLLRYSVGNTFQISFMVRKDSDIRTIRDLKGRRVASSFGGHPMIQRLIAGAAAAHGMSVKDFKPVPVVGVVDGVQAVIDGRAEASWGPFGMPIVRQGNSKVGLRFLSLDNTPEVLATMRKLVFPGISMTTFRGNLPWVPKGTNLLTYGWYLVANKDTDAKIIKAVLQATWDKSAEVQKLHPALRGWKNDAAVIDDQLVPYHPAAIAFYKEKGVWTDKAQATQDALMKAN